MDKEVQRLLGALEKLNSSLLSMQPRDFAGKLTTILARLKERVLKLLVGKDIMREISANVDLFNLAIKGYASEVSLSDQARGAISRSIVKQYTDQISGLLKTTESMQRQKKAVSAIRIAAQAKADSALIKTNPDLPKVTFTMNGKEYTLAKHSFDGLIEGLNKEYGLADTIRYRNGTNYPLGAYLDGKVKTRENEINRMTTQVLAAKSGTMTGRISAHNAKDTCREWENQVVFFSESAKQLFQAQFPDIDVSGIPTLEDAVKDAESHIFKFNCKHTVTPYPVQHFRTADMKRVLAA